MGSCRPKGKGWWTALIVLLGFVLLLLAFIGLGVREIARAVSLPETGESAQLKNAFAVAVQIGTPLTSMTLTLSSAPSAAKTNDAQTSAPARESSTKPAIMTSVQECIQRMNDNYRAYLAYYQQKNPEKLRELLDALQKQKAFLATETWDLVRKKMLTEAEYYRMLRFYQLLSLALQLEPFVLENDWESGAYYCRTHEWAYRWETELYFLKQMGARGYFIILKRAPLRLWSEYRRGKMSEVFHQNPRF